MQKTQKMLDEFYQLTKIPYTVLDVDGSILNRSEWQDICTQFHRQHPKTERRCQISDATIKSRLDAKEGYIIYKCQNGLISASTPIIIEGVHLATLFLGQLFFKTPDMAYFQRQAEAFGFDVDTYLAAVERVPIVTVDQLHSYMKIFRQLAEVIADMGLKQLRLKETEESLRKANDNLESLVRKRTMELAKITDNMQDSICLVNREGVFQYVSPSIKNFLGYVPEDWMGRTSYEMIHPHDIDKLYKIMKLLIYNGLPRKVEYRCRHVKGHYVWVESIVNLLLDDNNIPVKIVISTRDITERKQAEEALRESEERYQFFFELLPDGIFVYCDEQITFVNTAGARLVGFANPQEVIGKEIMSIINVHPDYQEAVEERRQKLYRGEKRMPLLEQNFICPDGTIVDVEVAATAFTYKGKNSVMIVMRDITKRKKTEELRRKAEENKRLLDEALKYDKLRTEFFANLSHEFRTPLNVILSALQLLEVYLQNQSFIYAEKTNNYKNIMKQNCLRLLRLVNNLIDITKIDSDFFEVNCQNHNIVNIVEDITLSVAEYIENNNLKLLFDTDVEEKIIACDPDKIERIMLNLLSNAVKFSKHSGMIRVNVHDKGESIVISVKDNGVGIPEEKQAIIFERFRQVDKTFTRNHEGSGIGLSLVYSLVEMHGGKIFVVSEYDVGSEFVIELPVKVLDEVDNTEVNEKSEIQQDYMERINIEFSDIYL